MHSAEREQVIQDYSVGNSSRGAVSICGGCLAILVLIVVVGSPQTDEYAQANRPTAIAAAQGKRVGAQSEQHRRDTFEARRVAFTRRPA